MAPIKKRARTRARAAQSSSSTHTPRLSSQAVAETTDPTTSSFPDSAAPDTSEFADFASTKKDKKRIRHSQFVSRIEKTAPGKKALKRRRPGKKLIAGLEGLLDSLPDVEDGDGDEWEGISDEDTEGGNGLAKIARVRRRKRTGESDGKMVLTTLKSRPGAAKRKKKLEGAEMERFRRNMAQMTQAQTQPVGGKSTDQTATAAATAATTAGAAGSGSHNSDRWAALRGFIGQTMEQSPHFRK